MWRPIVIPGAFAVLGGMLIAGWQLMTLFSRPLRLRASAVAHRHRRVGGQSVQERYAAWHVFRIGVFAAFCGAAGLVSGYHAAAISWPVLLAGCAAVLIWDWARWLRHRRLRVHDY